MCQWFLSKQCIFSHDDFLDFRNLITLNCILSDKTWTHSDEHACCETNSGSLTMLFLCILNFSPPHFLHCLAQSQNQIKIVYQRHCKSMLVQNVLVILHNEVWELRESTLEFSNEVTAALALNSSDSCGVVSSLIEAI